MDKVVGKNNDGDSRNLIVVATQALEAGVDISAAVLFTELSSWSSMVQRFGRANRYAELEEGADIRWIDLTDTKELSLPYTAKELEDARKCLQSLDDVAPACLPAPADIEPSRHVIRRKDFDSLFDTDSDLTGFDIDIAPYIRDAKDTDIRVFWRDLNVVENDPLRPRAEELCAVSIASCRNWIRKAKKQDNNRLFIRDPQWRPVSKQNGAPQNRPPPGWMRLTQDPWPGLTLLAGTEMGGYSRDSGFTGNPKDEPDPVEKTNKSPAATAKSDGGGEDEGHYEDSLSEIGVLVPLSAHLEHVVKETQVLCKVLDLDDDTKNAIVRAAHWHDVGKIHDVFQKTMKKGLDKHEINFPLAKTSKRYRHDRAFFRHELASALALLAHDEWSWHANLIAYLIAAHHGKVRMNLRPLPRELSPPKDSGCAGKRFARGVWEGDKLEPLELGNGERWSGGALTLSTMEIGWDERTRESWTERTRDLLARFGPFHLAWMETIVRLADWRASGKEERGEYDDI